jgi:hypothetical protein
MDFIYVRDYCFEYLKCAFDFRPDLLAACADDSKVKVLDTTASALNLM